MKKLFCVFAFVLSFSFIFAAPKAPAWYSNIESVYPTEDFLAEIGMGQTEQSAQANALELIARNFTVNVDTSSINQIYATSDSYDETNQITNVISANVDLIGVEFSESYFNKKEKTYYVAGYINRNNAYDLIKNKIELPANNIQGFVENADSTTDPLLKALSLSKTLDYAVEFEEQYSFIKMLNPQAAKKYNAVHKDLLGVNAQVQSLFKECKICISVENDYNGTVLSKAKSLFNKSGVTVVNAGGNYVATVTVNMDVQSAATGTFYYPAVDVVITGPYGDVASFGQAGERVGAKNADVAQKRAYKSVEELLESSFKSQFIVQ